MRNRELLMGGLVLTLVAGCSEDTTPTCSDECPESGVFGCASPPDNGLVVCADFDEDECLEWGGFFACDNDSTCVDGACAGGCDDECTPSGARVCDGNGFRECGDHDSDPCLEWSDVTDCPSQETCSDGVCSGSCSDECSSGDRACDGDGFRTCGQHDTDTCLDWSPVEECDSGETCSGGQCQPDQCLDEGEDCECGEDQCCEGHCCPFLFICVSTPPDEDHCF